MFRSACLGIDTWLDGEIRMIVVTGSGKDAIEVL
jgi:hypothetical protein